MTRNLTLGIDIGTTKVAAVIADPAARIVLESASLDHTADIPNTRIPGASEQSVDVIFAAIQKVVSTLNLDARQRVGAIGITGQMHGVVLFDEVAHTHSPLVTWQDNRCIEGNFLGELQTITGDSSLKSGFGLSTLAWWARYQPDLLKEYSSCSTIHGFLATTMCTGCEGGMDPSDAASFGLFDVLRGAWKVELIRRCGVDPSLLPKITKAPAQFGNVSSEWASILGVAQGIPVGIPVGDNQASLYGSLSEPHNQIALTIGTGAQVSVVLDKNPEQIPEGTTKYEIRPYFDSKCIAVGASLGGGRTLAALAHALGEFITSLGITNVPDTERIYSVLQVLGGTKLTTDLKAQTSFAGERYDQNLRGSLTNISFENFTMGDIFASLSRGLVESLKELLPQEMYNGKVEVVGSGNAIRRSSIMQKYIEEVFGTRLIVTPGGETTCSGVAFLAGRLL
jgi:sedoheptulokinase